MRLVFVRDPGAENPPNLIQWKIKFVCVLLAAEVADPHTQRERKGLPLKLFPSPFIFMHVHA